jgi:hypothetical protein
LPNVYLIGYRGTGFKDKRYAGEAALIRAGHVGISFEGKESMILGFHPTQAASEEIGDDEAVIEWLKEHHSLDGTLQEDTSLFVRAYELAQQGARTTVWQMTIPLSEEDFERIRAQALAWYEEQKIFAYAFPPDDEPPLDTQDNCATFPRKLGLPLPEATGKLLDYIPAIEAVGEKWKARKD